MDLKLTADKGANERRLRYFSLASPPSLILFPPPSLSLSRDRTFACLAIRVVRNLTNIICFAPCQIWEPLFKLPPLVYQRPRTTTTPPIPATVEALMSTTLTRRSADLEAWWVPATDLATTTAMGAKERRVRWDIRCCFPKIPFRNADCFQLSQSKR